jgi:hypothetical protein
MATDETNSTNVKRVRIVNEGKPAHETRVTDAETGELIEHVTRVELVLAAGDRHLPQAQITTFMPVVDVIVNAEISAVCPCCGQAVDQQKGTLALIEPQKTTLS